uniref:MARVEL domain-containing protein n=3 Tax=Meloidogyne TaxID=189290 RepID=A0A6V7WBS2_MELEN|nr:unnamed protein product [Meloidogyne enterolobii]
MAFNRKIKKMPIAPTQSSPMDRVYRRIDFEQLKMPIGFIRLLEAVFCLIVFAAFHGWQFDLDIKCGPPTKKNQTERATYEYHSLDISGYKVHRCNDSDTEVFLFKDDFGSGTDFYSYLIPLSLFLTTGMLLFYIFSYGVYASDDRLPILDLTVTALLAVFWMFGTLFFSISARRIEEATKPENVNATLAAIDICGGRKCEYTSYSVHATLAIASLAGVGLFILFTGNIWYIYKETPYFRNRQSRRNLHHNNLPAVEPYTLE